MAPVETVAVHAGPLSAVPLLLLVLAPLELVVLAPEVELLVEPDEELDAGDPLLVPPLVLDVAPDPLPLVELAGPLPDAPPPPEL